MHLDQVAQNCMPLLVFGFEAMGSVKSTWSRKAEENRAAGVVLFDRVTHRPVAANGAHSKRTVETHRRPFHGRPQAILAAGERIDQRSNNG